MWASTFLPALKLLGWTAQHDVESAVGYNDPVFQASYDGPIADGGFAWKHAFERAEAAVKQMTLEEKVDLEPA